MLNTTLIRLQVLLKQVIYFTLTNCLQVANPGPHEYTALLHEVRGPGLLQTCCSATPRVFPSSAWSRVAHYQDHIQTAGWRKRGKGEKIQFHLHLLGQNLITPYITERMFRNIVFILYDCVPS